MGGVWVLSGDILYDSLEAGIQSEARRGGEGRGAGGLGLHPLWISIRRGGVKGLETSMSRSHPTTAPPSTRRSTILRVDLCWQHVRDANHRRSKVFQRRPDTSCRLTSVQVERPD